ncbi:HTH-type transcriptional repressor of iron protein A [mine drainage metagenome]|uniref:HTH-type transcriptional repressor of iron protein A n=1 Tax=mine drainage metagenome TaxID=410659 RepID=A0A1J5QJ82_9ZZZZ
MGMFSSDRPPPLSRHADRIRWLEEVDGPLVPVAADYGAHESVPRHSHSRAQLLYAWSGAVIVTTGEGRWLIPPDHALWIPPRTEHAVEAHGAGHHAVRMLSLFVRPDALADLPGASRVVGVTDLMRSLIVEAVAIPLRDGTSRRDELIMALLKEEIVRLPEKPLGLPLPRNERLAALCRDFLQDPSPHTTIDHWADRLAMSRSAFTRLFRRETGLGLAAWRQQACLFAALPRLADGEAVTSVALDLGYDSIAAFSTMFKRVLGAPPSAYLRTPRG